MKRTVLLSLLVAGLFVISSCRPSLEQLKVRFGPVETALPNVADAVYGEYEENIPKEFNVDSLLVLLKMKRPNEYELLSEYKLEFESRTQYYLLKVYCGSTLRLFDYSCTDEVDGPQYRIRDTLDVNDDKCATK